MEQHELDDLVDGLKVIDCDSHFTEPADTWSSRVTGRWAERMPVLRTVDGQSSWYLDGEVWASVGGNVIGRDHKRNLGILRLQPFDAIDPSSWSVPERLELLDKERIWAQVLYPNGVGFASNHIFAIDDLEQRRLVLETYNDFLVDVQTESNERLIPQALLPVWDMDLTVKEMTRMLDKGIRGFTLTDKPEMIDLPELPEPYFDPMWDLFNESGAVVNFHIGSGRSREEIESFRRPEQFQHVPYHRRQPHKWAHFEQYPQRGNVVVTSQTSFSNMRIIANLCLSNLFDRYPKLKVVSVESGIGWVPFLLEEMDYAFDDGVVDERERAYAKRRPVEYFHDHIYTMFFFERSAPERLLDIIGIDHVMVETDIPHPACVYPGAVEHFKRVLAKQPEDVIRKVLQDNAVNLYRLTNV